MLTDPNKGSGLLGLVKQVGYCAKLYMHWQHHHVLLTLMHAAEKTTTKMACNRCDHRLLDAAPDAEAGPGEEAAVGPARTESFRVANAMIAPLISCR